MSLPPSRGRIRVGGNHKNCKGLLHRPLQERLILEKHKEKLYFDSQICKKATFTPLKLIILVRRTKMV